MTPIFKGWGSKGHDAPDVSVMDKAATQPNDADPCDPVFPAAVAVYAAGRDDAVRAKASQLAEKLGLPLLSNAAPGYDMLLAVTEARLELRLTGCRALGPVYVDFVGGRMGYSRRVNRFGRLFRAVGLGTSTNTVVDATAGLGKDAFLLAYYGCRVTAVERSPVLAALLEDGIERAMLVGLAERPVNDPPQAEESLSHILGDRLRLIGADARDVLKDLPAADAPDVVYLDPMFPPREKSALVKKEMRVLRGLVGDDRDAGELLETARAVARHHVVVKRMRYAPPLGPAPARSYRDKTARYDIYLSP